MRRTIGFCALMGAFVLLGCSDSEKLYDVSGTITYNGNPIPKGLIFFDPEKGTPGTQGFANIENGQYNTATPGKGKGIRGGNYAIRIGGFDGKEAPESPFGRPLFPEYTMTKEFPAQNQTFDHDIKKAGKGP